VEEQKELFLQRERKAEELQSEGIPPYPNHFRVSHAVEEVHSSFGSMGEED
jgi:lysyl-tRNA synthetase class II